MADHVEEIGVLLSDIKVEKVEWLWEGMIPIGYVTIFEGDPGLGKSALTLDLAARVSTGSTFPDGSSSEKAGVVLMTAEDGLGDVVRPRLEAARADLRLVAGIQLEHSGYAPPTVTQYDHLQSIALEVQKVSARLLIVDPLVAFMDDGTDSHKDHSVRRALGPLTAFARRRGIAVVAVRHLNKSREGLAIHRGGGSIGIIGAARSAFVVAKKPGDERRRVLASVKSNLSRSPQAFEFMLEEAENGYPTVKWLGRSDVTADSLLSTPIGTTKRSAVDEASDFLHANLVGGERSWADLVEAASASGISEATLRRARRSAGFKSRREGGSTGSHVFWSLPEDAGPDTRPDEQLYLFK